MNERKMLAHTREPRQLHRALASVAHRSLSRHGHPAAVNAATDAREKTPPHSVPALSFFSLVFSKIPRKTSKTPRIDLTLRALKTSGKQAENTPKDQGISSSKKKHQGNKAPRKRRTGWKRGNSEDFSLLVTFLLVTFSWLLRGPHLLRKTVLRSFSWLFRGSPFGQILRALALEKSSEKQNKLSLTLSTSTRGLQSGV